MANLANISEYPKKRVFTTSYLNSLENKKDRISFSANTKGSGILQVSFMDWEPMPIILSARLVFNINTQQPKTFSLTKQMRKSEKLRDYIENATIGYIELRNESLRSDAFYQGSFSNEVN